MKEAKNKLWAAPTEIETIQTAEEYAHSYCNSDHCLVIAQDRPKGFTEVDDEIGKLLTADDWRWILTESDKLRREQEERIHRNLVYEQKQFIGRFLDALREEARPHEQKEAESRENGSHEYAERTGGTNE